MTYHLDHAPYGFARNVIGALPIEEQQEYWRIHDRKRRSAKAQARLDELVDKAHLLWDERKKARQVSGSSEQPPTDS